MNAPFRVPTSTLTSLSTPEWADSANPPAIPRSLLYYCVPTAGKSNGGVDNCVCFRTLPGLSILAAHLAAAAEAARESVQSQ